MQTSDTDRSADAADDFLPVGMLNNGHASVQMMQAIAMQKMVARGVADWEPFHYEKISATEFELTGAVPLITGNNRKWLEPHTTVMVSEEEIAQGLRAAAPTESHDDATPPEATRADKSQAPASPPRPVAAPGPGTTVDADIDATHMVVTLRLPDDLEGRRRLLDALRVGSDFFGATVTASVTGRDGAAR